MSSIIVRNLTSEISYPVVSLLSESRAIINCEGLMVFADRDPEGGWQLSGRPPSPAEQLVLERAIEASTGFDRSNLTVVPPSDPPEAA